MPVLAVIAGPNGSGKTTFSNLWRHCLSYPLHNFPVSDPDAVDGRSDTERSGCRRAANPD